MNHVHNHPVRCEYKGLQALKLESETFEAVILPDYGANLIRFFDKKKSLRILHEPSEMQDMINNPYEFGVPVLFFPNRIKDGVFHFESRTYQFSINEPNSNCHLHGFLHDKSWDIHAMDLDEDGCPRIVLGYLWNNFDCSFQCFPHECEFLLELKLEQNGISQSLTIKNKSSMTMPVGLGYHTSFEVPQAEEMIIKTCAEDQWILDEKYVSTGKLKRLDYDQILNIDLLSDRVFGHFRLKNIDAGNDMFTAATITYKNKKARVNYNFGPQFKNLVIWNKNGKEDFICIEPQTCAIDAFNLEIDQSISNILGLAAGKELNLCTKIEILDGIK